MTMCGWRSSISSTTSEPGTCTTSPPDSQRKLLWQMYSYRLRDLPKMFAPLHDMHQTPSSLDYAKFLVGVNRSIPAIPCSP